MVLSPAAAVVTAKGRRVRVARARSVNRFMVVFLSQGKRASSDKGGRLFAPLLFDEFDRFAYIVTIAEGGQTEVAFAARAEAAARSADHMALVEQLVEKVPAGHALGSLEPDVGSVDAAVAGDAGRGQAFADDAGVVHGVVDHALDLGPAFP